MSLDAPANEDGNKRAKRVSTGNSTAPACTAERGGDKPVADVEEWPGDVERESFSESAACLSVDNRNTPRPGNLLKNTRPVKLCEVMCVCVNLHNVHKLAME